MSGNCTRFATVPYIRAYLRGRAAPIVEDLDDEDPSHHFSLLSAYFFDAVLDDRALPKMLSYLNAEGDRCILNRRHLMLWAIDWEYRVSTTTMFEADGLYQAGRDAETGIWRIQVWQLRANLFDVDDLLSEWYANVEFVPIDQSADALYEFDTYGPYPSKSEAATTAQTDFESGRYHSVARTWLTGRARDLV